MQIRRTHTHMGTMCTRTLRGVMLNRYRRVQVNQLTQQGHSCCNGWKFSKSLMGPPSKTPQNWPSLFKLWHTGKHIHVQTHTHTSHLCRLDVTVHLVIQLVHLQLQQRESGDMSFRNKACSAATGGCLIDVGWTSQNTPCQCDNATTTTCTDNQISYQYLDCVRFQRLAVVVVRVPCAPDHLKGGLGSCSIFWLLEKFWYIWWHHMLFVPFVRGSHVRVHHTSGSVYQMHSGEAISLMSGTPPDQLWGI